MDTIKTLLEAQQKLAGVRTEELPDQINRQILLAELHVAEALRVIEMYRVAAGASA